MAMSDGKALSAQRQADDSIGITAWLVREENYPHQIFDEANNARDQEKSQEILRQRILEHFPAWSPLLTRWIQAATVVRPWNLYELPVGHTFQHKRGYTLISDAAHLALPFAGEGVNAGMKDALELSETIVKSLSENTDLDRAVADFEHAMFVRGTKVQADSSRNRDLIFGPHAPVRFPATMTGEVLKMVLKRDPDSDWVAWTLSWPLKGVAWCCFSVVQQLGIRTGWFKGVNLN